ncbi:shikimate dehydrogenase [Buchnera aphidicola]|uniref:Shikimate dehydrogenase (NADP(+)) n=1 Tax=Buchnera aphidicola (Sarucallis kahawaluokalani) TaxID=1241878 RepID=A0A4D6YM68_9GAMM|nr:shikimate dehydrogenase [Buchnera aphidicola]QCI26105.1 shikimate dehydrogenase [Buchnera aphidicola (Sarucallis kahawaluokalani)]
MILKNNYLLFGNPVNHSKSPIIYQYFSKQTNVKCNYDVKCITKDIFAQTLLDFFSKDGKGANITVPFKEEAYKLANVVTKRALITKSVNVLKKINNKIILGDNTDGIGCIYDLQRLRFIKMNQKILLIGAGGAARGIIPNLLSLNCSIDIVNRTFSTANDLALYFKNFGKIQAINIDKIKILNYHIVINATSSGMSQERNFFLSNMIFYPERTVFYDLYYNDQLTVFLKWYQDYGGMYYSDGIGMLVSQAAYSFYLWNGVFPDVTSVIYKLNKNKKYFLIN